MPAYQLSPEELRLGHPTPFALRDASGHLLMARGTVIDSEGHRLQLLARGVFIDEQDGVSFRRALAGKLDSMLHQNQVLGKIAEAQPDSPAADITTSMRRGGDPLAVFGSLQMHFGKLLREPPQADFLPRLSKLQTELTALVSADADTVLLMLIDATTSELRQYSVTHAMLVAVVCELAARHLPEWPDGWQQPLRCAALTMNMAMTALQDMLALQPSPPSAQQRAQIDCHAERSAALLLAAGVSDPLWLAAVRDHHDAPPGPLAELPPARQLARLIQRADIFAARLSPRSKRAALSGAAAAKSTYLDERQQPDEAGAAIIKAVGIYPPGSYVRLASSEVAVVLRRGVRANEPIVASVLGRAGTPVGEPMVRNTRLPAYAVTAGVAPQEVKLRLNLERLQRLL